MVRVTLQHYYIYFCYVKNKKSYNRKNNKWTYGHFDMDANNGPIAKRNLATHLSYSKYGVSSPSQGLVKLTGLKEAAK